MKLAVRSTTLQVDILHTMRMPSKASRSLASLEVFHTVIDFLECLRPFLRPRYLPDMPSATKLSALARGVLVFTTADIIIARQHLAALGQLGREVST